MGRSTTLGPGTRCIRALFIVCNLICLLLGAAATGIGIWGIVDSNEYAVITGSSVLSAAVLLLIAGIFIFVIAGLGILGAWALWRPPLVIYAIALLFLFIVQLIAAILVFIFQDNIRDQIEDNMKEAIQDYRVNSDDSDHESEVNDAVEGIQETFDCCGVDNASDWLRYNNESVLDNNLVLPAGCSCDLDDNGCIAFNATLYNGTTLIEATFEAWEDGCLTLFEDNQERINFAIGITAIVVAVIEVLLALMALGLCFCVQQMH